MGEGIESVRLGCDEGGVGLDASLQGYSSRGIGLRAECGCDFWQDGQ